MNQVELERYIDEDITYFEKEWLPQGKKLTPEQMKYHKSDFAYTVIQRITRDYDRETRLEAIIYFKSRGFDPVYAIKKQHQNWIKWRIKEAKKQKNHRDLLQRANELLKIHAPDEING